MGLFNKDKKKEKVNVSAVIDANLFEMLEDLQEEYKLKNISSTINDTLDTFRMVCFDDEKKKVKEEFEDYDDKKMEDNNT